MLRHAKSFLLAAAVVLTSTTPAAALEYTIWHSPRTLESLGSLITLRPGLQSAGTELNFTGTGNEWVLMPLTVPSNVTVTGVVLCYQISNPDAYIGQVRITEMTTSDAGYVRIDDGTIRDSSTPECVTVPANMSFDGTLTLYLRVYAFTSDAVVKIGGIGIVVDDGVGAAPEPFTAPE